MGFWLTSERSSITTTSLWGILGRPFIFYVFLRRNIPRVKPWILSENSQWNTGKPWLPPADKDSEHYDGRISNVSTPVLSWDHGEHSGLLCSISIQVVIDWWSTYAEPNFDPLSAPSTMAGVSSYFHVIGEFLPIQAHPPIIYIMPGVVGDFQVHGGSRSQLIVKSILWREVIRAARRSETIYINIYNN